MNNKNRRPTSKKVVKIEDERFKREIATQIPDPMNPLGGAAYDRWNAARHQRFILDLEAGKFNDQIGVERDIDEVIDDHYGQT